MALVVVLRPMGYRQLQSRMALNTIFLFATPVFGASMLERSKGVVELAYAYLPWPLCEMGSILSECVRVANGGSCVNMSMFINGRFDGAGESRELVVVLRFRRMN